MLSWIRYTAASREGTPTRLPGSPEPRVSRVRRTHTSAVVVGSRVRFRAHFPSRTLEYTYEVRELEPGRRFVMATAQGPFRMETTYTWEDEADGATKMTLRHPDP